MKYYLITFDGMPKITFAHGYDTANYALSYDSSDELELVFTERGDVVFAEDGGGSVFIPEGSVWLLYHGKAGRMSCPTGSHSHFTVMFSGVKTEEISEEKIVSLNFKNSVAVPEFVPDMKSGEIAKIIKNTVRLWASPHPCRETVGVGYLLTALGELTKIALDNGNSGSGKGTDSIIGYRAKSYISLHIGDNVTVSDVAAHLEISTGYLSRIFRKTENCTAVNYINRVKIDKIRELLSDRGVTLAEAGEMLGISDSNYVSRLFKKYVGMSYREYVSLRNNHQ